MTQTRRRLLDLSVKQEAWHIRVMDYVHDHWWPERRTMTQSFRDGSCRYVGTEYWFGPLKVWTHRRLSRKV